MHAINNFLQRPVCDKALVRSAAADVVQLLGNCREEMEHHLDPRNGWLSLDVINMIGASLAEPFHVEEASLASACWSEECRKNDVLGCFCNWNNVRWTVLLPRLDDNGVLLEFVRLNSCVGELLHQGRAACSSHEPLLQSGKKQYGQVSMHVV